VDKLQFRDQLFKIDLHLELLVVNHQGWDPASQARGKRRSTGEN
jgi:hypothetical protein